METMQDRELSNTRKRPATRGGAFYPRKRANAACQVCRGRKTKCDNRKPSCSYCLSVGAVCTWSAEDLSSFDPASLKILERLDVLESLVRQKLPQPREQGHVVPPRAQVPLSSSHARPENSRLDNPTINAFASPHSSKQTLSPSRCGASFSPLNVLPAQPECLLRLMVFQNRLPSGGLFNHDANECCWTEKRQRQPLHIPHGTSVNGGLLSGRINACGGVDGLLDRFFKFVHCKNPILKEAPTRRLVLSKAVGDVDGSVQSCLAFLVCALGCLATPFGETPDTQKMALYDEAEALFLEAQHRMGALFVDNEDDHLIGPQCLLLSGFYMMCMFRPFMAWRFFAQALATCQQFDFLCGMYSVGERQSNHGTESQNQETEKDSQEQAVYWTAWKSERELRRCLCLPDFPATGDTSHLYPPLFPTPPSVSSDNLIDEGRERASWLFYLAEISLRRLLSSMCDEILSLHRTNENDTDFLSRLATIVPEYEQLGRQWAASLPPKLSLEAPPESDDVCRFVLRGHYIDYREAIYWPFLATALNYYFNPSLHSSQLTLAPIEQRATASDASSAATLEPSSPGDEESPPVNVTHFAAKCLEIEAQRIQVNFPGFQHRHHGTFFMIWSCTRSALVLLSAALTGLPMPPGWRESIVRTTGLLVIWEAEMPQLLTWRDFLTSTLSDIP